MFDDQEDAQGPATWQAWPIPELPDPRQGPREEDPYDPDPYA